MRRNYYLIALAVVLYIVVGTILLSWAGCTTDNPC